MPRTVFPFSVMMYSPFSGTFTLPILTSPNRCIITGLNSLLVCLAISIAFCGLLLKSMVSSTSILIGDKLIVLSTYLSGM